MEDGRERERRTRDRRDASVYEQLGRLDRRGFAWEYLRRNPRFRQERQTSSMLGTIHATGALVLPPEPDPLALNWGLRFRRGSRYARAVGTPVLA